jgi:hypothetical protein
MDDTHLFERVYARAGPMPARATPVAQVGR